MRYPTKDPSTDETVTTSHNQTTIGVSPIALTNMGM
jgi:hypothetical protein